jgi:hypothetical protein
LPLDGIPALCIQLLLATNLKEIRVLVAAENQGKIWWNIEPQWEAQDQVVVPAAKLVHGSTMCLGFRPIQHSCCCHNRFHHDTLHCSPKWNGHPPLAT